MPSYELAFCAPMLGDEKGPYACKKVAKWLDTISSNVHYYAHEHAER